MTAIDRHILQLIETLSDDGKAAARKILGTKKIKKKTSSEIRNKLRKNLFSPSS